MGGENATAFLKQSFGLLDNDNISLSSIIIYKQKEFKMSLVYDDFYHPLGRGNTAINFNAKFEELKKKYFTSIVKDIRVSAVKNEKKDIYIFFFKIPSEENDKYPTEVYYDVILEFIPKNKSDANASDLKNYNINVFSNSPSFVFTFQYVIKHKYNAVPKCLPYNRLSTLAITKPPEIRNRNEILTVEKTTWWALFHLDRNGYLTKELANTIITKKPIDHYIKYIDSQPAKLKEIKTNQEILSEEKRTAKAKKNGQVIQKNYQNINKDEKKIPSLFQSLRQSMKENKLSKKMRTLVLKNNKNRIKMNTW